MLRSVNFNGSYETWDIGSRYLFHNPKYMHLKYILEVFDRDGNKISRPPGLEEAARKSELLRQKVVNTFDWRAVGSSYKSIFAEMESV